MSKRVAQILALIGLFFSFVLLSLVLSWYQFSYRPMNVTNRETVKLYPNTGIQALANRLYRKGLIQSPHWFVLFAYLHGDNNQLRFGEYHVRPGMTALQLLNNMRQGRDTVLQMIRFIEGWTFRDIMTYLNHNPNIRHTLTGLSPSAVALKLGIGSKNPEGLIFPDTYSVAWDSADVSILQRSYARMKNTLATLWAQRAKNLPYKNSYQALIVASMIEKEVKVSRERSKVAAVILRRLKKRMRLQIDATVFYGRNKSYTQALTKQDLRVKTAYNTYRNYGLPPTPISMPGKAAIIAALHPAKSDALYYVSRGDGTHVFSKTYKQHLSAVRRYQRSSSVESTAAGHEIITPAVVKKMVLMKLIPYIMYFIIW